MIYQFRILDPIPSKKNALKRGRYSRMYTERSVKEQIELIEWELMKQKQDIKGYKRIDGPAIVLVVIEVPPYSGIYEKTGGDRQDLDNMKTTLWDALQKVGIVKNDKNIVIDLGVKIRNAPKQLATIYVANDYRDMPELLRVVEAQGKIAFADFRKD